MLDATTSIMFIIGYLILGAPLPRIASRIEAMMIVSAGSENRMYIIV